MARLRSLNDNNKSRLATSDLICDSDMEDMDNDKNEYLVRITVK
jgi:hypothetical protein